MCSDEINVTVQVNGKTKATLKVPAGIDDVALEAAALADERIRSAIGGRAVKKAVVRSKKLVNLIVS